MEFQIQYVGGKTSEEDETNYNICSSNVSCMQNCSVGGNKTGTVGVNPQQ